MKNFLQGKWLNHPLHPALVHIPVSMWIASVGFDLLSRIGIGTQAISQLAAYAIALGLLVALLAIPTGLADWWEISQDKLAWKLGVFHMALNWVASLSFGVSLGLRLASGTGIAARTLPFVLSLTGLAFLLVGVYLGGRMTYDNGISVARNSKGRWRKLAEKGGARVSSKKCSIQAQSAA